jgi:hypothetical protein
MRRIQVSSNKKPLYFYVNLAKVNLHVAGCVCAWCKCLMLVSRLDRDYFRNMARCSCRLWG